MQFPLNYMFIHSVICKSNEFGADYPQITAFTYTIFCQEEISVPFSYEQTLKNTDLKTSDAINPDIARTTCTYSELQCLNA